MIFEDFKPGQMATYQKGTEVIVSAIDQLALFVGRIQRSGMLLLDTLDMFTITFHSRDIVETVAITSTEIKETKWFVRFVTLKVLITTATDHIFDSMFFFCFLFFIITERKSGLTFPVNYLSKYLG